MLTGQEIRKGEWKGQLGMDYEIKQVEIEDRKWLQVGLVFNKKVIYYLYPEYIQKLILDRCLIIVKEAKGEIPPDHMCFNVLHIFILFIRFLVIGVKMKYFPSELP